MDDWDAILSRLLKLHPLKIDLSLGRIERLLNDMGRPQDRLPPVIHVAGTNGKGSTIAFMRAILEAAGKSVHVYTSPHLVRFHERIRIGHQGGGKLVGDIELAAALTDCEKTNKGLPITFFEITTAAAFKIFAENPADYLLLEVGLGGRIDATNVVAKPAATVITPVSFDHPEYLGFTVEKIAYEKAGIMKPGVPAIFSTQQELALAVLEHEAHRIGAPFSVASQDYMVRDENGRLIFEDENGLLDLPHPRLPGRHQFSNAGAAIATIRKLEPDFPAEIYEKGMQQAQWAARLQHLTKGELIALAPKGSDIWLDGGHNEDGGRVLGQAMADFEDRDSRPLILICGTLASKDTTAFLRAFSGLAQEVIAVPVEAEQAQARTPREVSLAAADVGLAAAACESVEAALRYLSARPWQASPRILIAGSLFLAGTVLRINGTPPE